MTKIKIGDIVEGLHINKWHESAWNNHTGIVTRRIDVEWFDDIKGRYFCVRSFEDGCERRYKIKEIKLLS